MSMRDVYVTVRGNATSDAHTTNNQSEPSVMVRIAVNRRYYDKGTDGYKDAATPDFFNIYGTKALGRNMLRSVKKGDPIIATGRLSYSEWTWDDGSEGRSMQVRADSVGHDLVFGTTRMTRSQRSGEPPVDVITGEMLGAGGASGAPVARSVGADEDDGNLGSEGSGDAEAAGSASEGSAAEDGAAFGSDRELTAQGASADGAPF